MEASPQWSTALPIEKPTIFNTVKEIRTRLQEVRNQGQSISFVPTMGNLHQGHFDLILKASELADHVVVSIFVNPMQFGPHEDFDAYPRTLATDFGALSELPCQSIFAPTVREIYPKGVSTEIDVPSLSTILCGQHRPGHFRGVATIVNKLLNIVEPQYAILGKKDYQQLQVIETMVSDLLMPIKIVGVETTREPSGLAMSSRNAYLSEIQRTLAAELFHSLNTLAIALAETRHMSPILKIERQRLTDAGFIVDYLEIRNADNISATYLEATRAVILVAARLGKARLIDNLVIHLTH